MTLRFLAHGFDRVSISCHDPVVGRPPFAGVSMERFEEERSIFQADRRRGWSAQSSSFKMEGFKRRA
jgi:hypothetical protein